MEKTYELLSVDIAGRVKLSRDLDSLLETARKETKFTLDSIRLNSKDVNTKAVSCTANLNAIFQDGKAHRDIHYRVELTTDKDLHVTVRGL